MALLFVTRKIPEAGIMMLRDAGHEVDISEKDGVLEKSELCDAVASKPYEGIVSLLTDTIDAEVLEAAPHVRIIANYAVGFDNIDVGAANERAVTVTNTPGVLTSTVAEYTIALMLTVVKRIAEADRFTRAGKYVGWAPELFLGEDLYGKTLGIVGAGRIGKEVAMRAKHGFSMNILYTDIQRSEALEQEVDCTYAEDTERVLSESDVVSLHLPYNKSTHHLINADLLSLMKPSAFLINTSRGAVIDEEALAVALTQKQFAGAGIDVYEHEPAITPELLQLDNVVLTPHIASASHGTRQKMSEIAAKNIIDFFEGVEPKNVVRK